jgi:uracil-DNA glycosylase
VTNIWVKDSPKERELPFQYRDTRLFEFMLRRLKPKVILAHGEEAKDFFEEKCQGVKRNSDSAHVVSFEEHEFLLVCSRHLSHQMGEAEAKGIGRKLHKALARANQ